MPLPAWLKIEPPMAIEGLGQAEDGPAHILWRRRALAAHWHHRGRTCWSFLFRTGRGHEARDPRVQRQNNAQER